MPRVCVRLRRGNGGSGRYDIIRNRRHGVLFGLCVCLSRSRKPPRKPLHPRLSKHPVPRSRLDHSRLPVKLARWVVPLAVVNPVARTKTTRTWNGSLPPLAPPLCLHFQAPLERHFVCCVTCCRPLPPNVLLPRPGRHLYRYFLYTGRFRTACR